MYSGDLQPTDLVADYGLENFKLTEEEKDKFVKLLCEGDIWGLEYIRDIVKERAPHCDTLEDLHDFVETLIELNRMVVHGEMFGGVHEMYYNQIYDLYYDMKMTFCELVGITDELWEKYW